MYVWSYLRCLHKFWILLTLPKIERLSTISVEFVQAAKKNNFFMVATSNVLHHLVWDLRFMVSCSIILNVSRHFMDFAAIIAHLDKKVFTNKHEMLIPTRFNACDKHVILQAFGNRGPISFIAFRFDDASSW